MDWLSDAAGALVGSGGSGGSGGAGAKDAEDLAFEEIAAYMDGLEPQLVNVQKHVATLVAKRREMASGLFEFGMAFTLLGQSERDALGDALTRLGHTADTLSMYSNKHAGAEDTYFGDPVKEYLRLVGAVKAALAHRGETQARLRATQQELDNRRNQVTKLKGVAGRERALGTAERAVADQEKVVADAEERHIEVTDRVLSELERFKREKLADVKNMVLDYVQLQIDYNKKLEEAWNALVPELEKVAVAAEGADLTTEVSAVGSGTAPPAPRPAQTAGAGGDGSA